MNMNLSRNITTMRIESPPVRCDITYRSTTNLKLVDVLPLKRHSSSRPLTYKVPLVSVLILKHASNNSNISHSVFCNTILFTLCLFIYLFIYLYQLYLHQKYINIYMQTVENGVPAGNNLRLIMPSWSCGLLWTPGSCNLKLPLATTPPPPPPPPNTKQTQKNTRTTGRRAWTVP